MTSSPQRSKIPARRCLSSPPQFARNRTIAHTSRYIYISARQVQSASSLDTSLERGLRSDCCRRWRANVARKNAALPEANADGPYCPGRRWPRRTRTRPKEGGNGARPQMALEDAATPKRDTIRPDWVDSQCPGCRSLLMTRQEVVPSGRLSPPDWADTHNRGEFWEGRRFGGGIGDRRWDC